MLPAPLKYLCPLTKWTSKK